MASLFQKDIKTLKGVGDKRAKLFSKLGINTVGALLLYYPRAYEDWSNITEILYAPLNEFCCIKATVTSNISKKIIRKNMIIYALDAQDDSATIRLTFFNNPFIIEKLVIGQEFLFFGKVTYQYGRREMLSPQFREFTYNSENIYPIYKQTTGLSSTQISTCVKNALTLLPPKINDPIPEKIRQKYDLCKLDYAIKNIHFPQDYISLNTAKSRIIFEELLLLQLGLMRLKHREKVVSPWYLEKDFFNEFLSLLPFSLTDAQLRTINECINDMQQGCTPMCRLVQGDVGSGKTAVAAALCYCATKNKIQVALMAPTEILAQQHYQWFSKIFARTDMNVSILTGSTKAKDKKLIKENLQDGTIELIIGTHALISQDVNFANLGLVITDEQHRFGVAQRAKLACKGNTPHILVLSATPIPRTLALIMYSDLDLSILDELPPGRQPIETFHIDSSKRPRMFHFLINLLTQGYQGYIVCPAIEESETLLSLNEYVKNFESDEWNAFNIGIIHGKMKNSEKEYIMQAFARNEINLLISTTVIEVGIDIPNAVFIVIENAERFGLSQLHQLRGRVGRGNVKSYCILVSDNKSKDTTKRLITMTQTNDGFKIAEQDLKLRGPGDFFGERQHGMPDLKMADMQTDLTILLQAQQACKDIIQKDPTISLEEHRGLLSGVNRLFDNIGENSLN